MNLLTTRQVADELGISARLVRRLADTMHRGERYPTQWLFTEEDVAAMRSRNRQRGPTRGLTRPVPALGGMVVRPAADAGQAKVKFGELT